MKMLNKNFQKAMGLPETLTKVTGAAPGNSWCGLG